MGKFRKKPLVVDAVEFLPTKTISGWQSNVPSVTPVVDHDHRDEVAWVVQTLEGPMYAQPGDWIITGVAGEVYPCKPAIFAQTYTPALEG